LIHLQKKCGDTNPCCTEAHGWSENHDKTVSSIGSHRHDALDSKLASRKHRDTVQPRLLNKLTPVQDYCICRVHFIQGFTARDASVHASFIRNPEYKPSQPKVPKVPKASCYAPIKAVLERNAAVPRLSCHVLHGEDRWLRWSCRTPVHRPRYRCEKSAKKTWSSGTTPSRHGIDRITVKSRLVLAFPTCQPKRRFLPADCLFSVWPCFCLHLLSRKQGMPFAKSSRLAE
jgi:hypothetical protein